MLEKHGLTIQKKEGKNEISEFDLGTQLEGHLLFQAEQFQQSGENKTRLQENETSKTI